MGLMRAAMGPPSCQREREREREREAKMSRNTDVNVTGYTPKICYILHTYYKMSGTNFQK